MESLDFWKELLSLESHLWFDIGVDIKVRVIVAFSIVV